MTTQKTNSLKTSSGLDLFWKGPPLEDGAKPTLLYLALSAEDSLELAPYNQPVDKALSLGMRVFSCTLPRHGKDLDPHKAMEYWAEDYAKGLDSIQIFLDALLLNIDFLVEASLCTQNKIAIAGLSRGGLVAGLAAAKHPAIGAYVGFAPLTALNDLAEFAPLQNSELSKQHALLRFVPELVSKRVRLHIGNRDTRVHTDSSYNLVRAIGEEAYLTRNRNGFCELIIKPSIGHQGHGTSTDTFYEGVEWITKI